MPFAVAEGDIEAIRYLVEMGGSLSMLSSDSTEESDAMLPIHAVFRQIADVEIIHDHAALPS